jgi:uncharacterized membrane protein YdjX (TVP38/TMEM64 family)
MSRRTLVRIAVAAVLIAVIAGIYFSPLRAEFTRDNIRHRVESLRGTWYGPLVLIGLYAVGCIFAIPATVFVFAAGFIWGWMLGGAYAWIGGLLGATASFLVARFVGEGLLDRFGYVGRTVAKRVDHAGFRSLLVLRLIPGIPFAVLNYGAGVAGVRLVDFVGATAIGLLPTFVFAYCADALFNGTMSEGDALKRVVIACLSLLGLVLLPQLIKRFTRRAEITPSAES